MGGRMLGQPSQDSNRGQGEWANDSEAAALTPSQGGDTSSERSRRRTEAEANPASTSDVWLTVRLAM